MATTQANRLAKNLKAVSAVPYVGGTLRVRTSKTEFGEFGRAFCRVAPLTQGQVQALKAADSTVTVESRGDCDFVTGV